jgi:hypothetical protein
MPIRSLLPWHRFALETSWSKADVERQLRGLLVERPSRGAGPQAWHGDLSDEGFRLAWGERSTLGPGPILALGRIEPSSHGSRVIVTMRLPLPTMLVLFVAVPILTVLSAAVSLAALVRNEGFVLLVWIMPFALWNSILRAFRRDASSGEAFFRKFFPPVAPPGSGPFR